MEWELYKGDCFEHLPKIKDKSVDMILCDLPYGTTACKWDTPLPLDDLWYEYKRVIKDNGAIVLTASQPFTTTLISSNYDMYKYNWVWEKSRPHGYLNAKKRPMTITEDIIIFSKNLAQYNPQGLIKGVFHNDRPWRKNGKNPNKQHVTGQEKPHGPSKYTNYPRNLIKFSNPNNNTLHPTQKPVALFEYLIKTYTNEGDLVLDNCAGSGTTGVACMNLNRNCIMMELEDEYCDIILKRMAENDQQKLI